MIAKSIEKHPEIKPGKYKGLMTGEFIKLILEDGTKTEPIELDDNVWAIDWVKNVTVTDEGILIVEL